MIILFDLIMCIVSGGIIGYLTNYIAIKMLFKPRNKIYIKGIPLPFTPGIIHKNRMTILNSISDIINSKVLTNEFLNNLFKNINIQEQISNYIDSNISKDDTVKSIINKLAPNIDINHFTNYFYNKNIKSEKYINIFSNILSNIIIELFKQHNTQNYIKGNSIVVQNDRMNFFIDKLSDNIYEYLISKDFNISNIINDDFKKILAIYLYKIIPNIISDIQIVLCSEPVKSEINKLVVKSIKDNIQEMGLGLGVLFAGNNLMDKIISSKIDGITTDIINNLANTTKQDQNLSYIIVYIINYISSDKLSKTISSNSVAKNNTLKKYIKSLLNNVLNPNFINNIITQGNLKQIINANILIYVNTNNFKSKYNAIIEKILNTNIFNYKIHLNNLISILSESFNQVIYNIKSNIKLEEITKKIVMKLDVLELEFILYKIMNKSLYKINVFGSFIGMIVNLVYFIIFKLY